MSKKELRKVFVAGDNAFIGKMFADRGFKLTNKIKESDIVVFKGGADISPQYYGQRPHPTTYFDTTRDKQDEWVFDHSDGKFRVGICRGGQFLNVMSGGGMYQDVDNHAIQGTHVALDVRSKRLISVTSTHHQMMDPSDEAVILMTARISHRRETDITIDKGPFAKADTEACWYEHTRSLCYQPHPEYVNGEKCRDHFFDLVEEFYEK